MKVFQYLCLHVNIICWRFHIRTNAFEICSREICEKSVYKHSDTMKYIKNWPTFWETFRLYGEITREFLELRMWNFQGIVFIWTQRCREIFKSAFVCVPLILVQSIILSIIHSFWRTLVKSYVLPDTNWALLVYEPRTLIAD